MKSQHFHHFWLPANLPFPAIRRQNSLRPSLLHQPHNNASLACPVYCEIGVVASSFITGCSLLRLFLCFLLVHFILVFFVLAKGVFGFYVYKKILSLSKCVRYHLYVIFYPFCFFSNIFVLSILFT